MLCIRTLSKRYLLRCLSKSEAIRRLNQVLKLFSESLSLSLSLLKAFGEPPEDLWKGSRTGLNEEKLAESGKPPGLGRSEKWKARCWIRNFRKLSFSVTQTDLELHKRYHPLSWKHWKSFKFGRSLKRTFSSANRRSALQTVDGRSANSGALRRRACGLRMRQKRPEC